MVPEEPVTIGNSLETGYWLLNIGAQPALEETYAQKFAALTPQIQKYCKVVVDLEASFPALTASQFVDFHSMSIKAGPVFPLSNTQDSRNAQWWISRSL